eukprot:1703538-Amphidinium_carterae.1
MPRSKTQEESKYIWQAAYALASAMCADLHAASSNLTGLNACLMLGSGRSTWNSHCKNSPAGRELRRLVLQSMHGAMSR